MIRALPGKESSDRIDSIKKPDEAIHKLAALTDRGGAALQTWSLEDAFPVPGRSEGQSGNNNRSSCNPIPDLLLRRVVEDTFASNAEQPLKHTALSTPMTDTQKSHGQIQDQFQFNPLALHLSPSTRLIPLLFYNTFTLLL